MLSETLPAGANPAISRSQPSWQIVELGKQLLHAARDGDTEKVFELMSMGAPFSTDWLGTSALHLAAMNNHPKTCAVLLRAGISWETRTKVDRTPLHLAAYEGHDQICNILLSHGAYVDCRDMLSMTPLHWAVERDHIECVKVLLEHGADPKAISKFYKTPMSIASESKKWDLLQLLQNSINDKMKIESEQEVGEIEIQPVETASVVEIYEEEITKGSESDPLETPTTDTTADEANIDHNVNSFMNDSKTDANDTSSPAAQLLRTHGISMQPATHPNTILSAINSGRTVLLSDAGKLMLKDSESAKPPTNHKQGVKIVTIDGTEVNKSTIIKKIVKVAKPNVIKIENNSFQKSNKVSNSAILNFSQLQALQKEGLIQLKSTSGLKGAVKIVTHKSNLGKLVSAANNNNKQGERENQFPFVITTEKKDNQNLSGVEQLRRELEQMKRTLKEKDELIELLREKIEFYKTYSDNVTSS